tara:strand:- start:347 stop:469 length:123 start_codon:yes stop_codon:yes gene_type:complete
MSVFLFSEGKIILKNVYEILNVKAKKGLAKSLILMLQNKC